MRISQMTVEMVKEVSNLHAEAFKAAMNTRMGRFYMNRLLKWFVRLEDGIALVAIVENEKGKQIVGYIVGAPLGYGKAMNRDMFWVAAWSVMLRPWLCFSKQIRRIIKSRLKILLETPQAARDVSLPLPGASLVGLAVLPSYQGQNIGRELIVAFEREARSLSFQSLTLSVYPENVAARRVYEKCGWAPSKSELNHGGTISYHRIL